MRSYQGIPLSSLILNQFDSLPSDELDLLRLYHTRSLQATPETRQPSQTKRILLAHGFFIVSRVVIWSRLSYLVHVLFSPFLSSFMCPLVSFFIGDVFSYM